MERIDLRQMGKDFFVFDNNKSMWYITEAMVQPNANSSEVYIELTPVANGRLQPANELGEKPVNSPSFDFLDYDVKTGLANGGYYSKPEGVVVPEIVYNQLKELMKKQEEKNTGFEIENGVLVKYSGHDEHIQIPEGVTAVGDRAFEHNKVLKSVLFPEGVTSIGKQSFAYCSNLENLFLRHSDTDNIKSIGIAAFTDCEKLERIDLPQTLESIGNYAFHRCENLKRIEIPNIKAVPCGAFEGCVSLKTVKIEEGVTKIETSAFWGCGNLSKVYLPSTLNSMGENAFNKCNSLKELSLPEDFDTSMLDYASVSQDCSIDCCIPDYSKFNGLTLTEFFKQWDGDVDTTDEIYDVTICCVSSENYSFNSNDPCDRFSKYIYDNVKVLWAKPDKDIVVCDWSGFIDDRYYDLREFMQKNWNFEIPEDDEELFHVEWMKEIHGFLAGNANDDMYKELLSYLKRAENTGENSELDLTEQERGRS